LYNYGGHFLGKSSVGGIVNFEVYKRVYVIIGGNEFVIIEKAD